MDVAADRASVSTQDDSDNDTDAGGAIDDYDRDLHGTRRGR